MSSVIGGIKPEMKDTLFYSTILLVKIEFHDLLVISEDHYIHIWRTGIHIIFTISSPQATIIGLSTLLKTTTNSLPMLSSVDLLNDLTILTNLLHWIL